MDRADSRHDKAPSPRGKHRRGRRSLYGRRAAQHRRCCAADSRSRRSIFTADAGACGAVRSTRAMTNAATARQSNPLLTLNNGLQMPALGLGVFQSPPEQTAGAVESALRQGYRLIDTAAAYLNERQVGEGLRRSGIPRDHVFIETKIWISDYGYDATLHAFDKAARKLDVDWIDLLLLHQPLPSRFDLTLDAYRALQTLLADGKVRAIGVSNFMPDHL